MTTAHVTAPHSPTLGALAGVRTQLTSLTSTVDIGRAGRARALHPVSSASQSRSPKSAAPASLTSPPAPFTSPLEDAGELVEAIGAIEELKNILDALQAGYEIALRNERIRAQEEAGLPASKLGSGTSDEIALARGISPSRAGNQLALRRVIVETLPRIWERMADGAASGWAAEEVARAVIVLDDADRLQIDAELAPSLHQLSPRAAGRRARSRADALDQEAALARLQRSIEQRHVSQRPAADGMMRLSALLPLHQGVAAFASLCAAADSARAQGDPRSRSQVMADALTARITGQEQAIAPVEIQLLMTDRTLLAGEDDTAELDGHPIAGPVARHLALTGRLLPPEETSGADTSAPTEVQRWIRRLYADPVDGALTAMDPRKRLFTGHMRRFILARERQCRTPGCEAATRHVHHVDGYAGGGATTPENAAGLCERFNYVVELPGWSTSRDPVTGDLVITTPTGHQHRSAIPDMWETVGIYRRLPTRAGQRPNPPPRIIRRE